MHFLKKPSLNFYIVGLQVHVKILQSLFIKIHTRKGHILKSSQLNFLKYEIICLQLKLDNNKNHNNNQIASSFILNYKACSKKSPTYTCILNPNVDPGDK
ncbi:hypothetical protein VIGAN_01493400 [Vigna angularis var. angularis]|uniref:Uncharacterized protein n=1 Tax=Vigna angularis var. angularis TaxID=157739 RepID=A0A0S3R891_PHAAN|nr:hypothetical protein VIGAN_01493400 [Vigna angularis var. angularis]